MALSLSVITTASMEFLSRLEQHIIQDMSCSVDVRQAGDVSIVDLSGRFTVGDSPGIIRDTVRGLVEAGRKNILLNLADVAYMDSAAGIGELIASYHLVIPRGGHLRLLNPSKRVHEVLELTKLDTVFEIFSDEGEAVRSFEAPHAV
jgi:anti-sigma B factor antagonist